MTTMPLAAGDVIELGAGDSATTALVLLVSDASDGVGFKVILDRCDGSCPVVVEQARLGAYRVFHPDLIAA